MAAARTNRFLAEAEKRTKINDLKMRHTSSELTAREAVRISELWVFRLNKRYGTAVVRHANCMAR